jgi:hypothetical protein
MTFFIFIGAGATRMEDCLENAVLRPFGGAQGRQAQHAITHCLCRKRRPSRTLSQSKGAPAFLLLVVLVDNRHGRF